MVKRKPKLERVDFPEKERCVFVRPLKDKERDLFEITFMISAPRAFLDTDPNPPPEGLVLRPPSPLRRLIASLISEIVILSARDREGATLFHPVDSLWMSEGLLERTPSFGTVALMRIAGAALILSSWVRPGEDPVRRFVVGYLNRYFPGGESFDFLPAAIPSTPENERAEAVKRIRNRHPRPIYSRRWLDVEGYILGRLDGRRIDEQILAAAAAAAIRTRRETGILDPKMKVITKFKRAYRNEAESGLEIDPHRGYEGDRKLTRGPKGKESQVSLNDGLTVRPLEKQIEESIEFNLIETITLQQRFERLKPEDQITIRTLFAAKGDRGEAAKKLRITKDALDTRIIKIRGRVIPQE